MPVIRASRRPRLNRDPSWDDEIEAFAGYILNDSPVLSGHSDDALRTMQLVAQDLLRRSRVACNPRRPDPTSHE